jgi:hypothetical protein
MRWKGKETEMVWELVQMSDGKKELANKLTAIQSVKAEHERKVCASRVKTECSRLVKTRKHLGSC